MNLKNIIIGSAMAASTALAQEATPTPAVCVVRDYANDGLVAIATNMPLIGTTVALMVVIGLVVGVFWYFNR